MTEKGPSLLCQLQDTANPPPSRPPAFTLGTCPKRPPVSFASYRTQQTLPHPDHRVPQQQNGAAMRGLRSVRGLTDAVEVTTLIVAARAVMGWTAPRLLDFYL